MIPSVLAWQVRETLLDYLRTTFALRDAALEQALFTFLGHPEHGLFQGPFVDLRLPFRTAGDGAEIPLEVRPPFVPYAHQIKAFGRLSSAGGAAAAQYVGDYGDGVGQDGVLPVSGARPLLAAERAAGGEGHPVVPDERAGG